MQNSTVVVDGNSLTIEDLVKVARFGGNAELSSASVSRIQDSRASLEKSARTGKTIYGVTTGFGALSNTRITLDEATQLQTNLLRSHACGVGENLPTEAVRAIMLLRINTLAKGLSGVRMTTVQAVLDFLNTKIHPVIPSRGSVGASGDLSPLSHMALALMGEGTVEYEGKLRPSLEVLVEKGLKPITVTMKEGLALNNGTQMSTGVAALAIYDAERLVKVSEISTALSLEALRGLSQAFDARIHEARPFQGQIESASNIRSLITASHLMRETVSGENEPAQDAYSLRCAPQVLGAAREAIAFARRIIQIEMNSATDNPLIFPDGPNVLSGGNFHGQPIGLAMDALSIALATIANISERRIFRLLDANLNGGLPAFLVGATEHRGLNSGLMAVQFTAAALASENKVLAHPASVDTIPTSANMEDFVSMSPTASLKAREILRNSQKVLAIELICAAQGLEFRDPSKCGKGTRAAYVKVREKVPMIKKDQPISNHIQAITDMVADGSLLEAVETDIGKLR